MPRAEGIHTSRPRITAAACSSKAALREATCRARSLARRRRLASLALSHDDFAWLTREIVQIGGGELPIVSVLEGGYNVDALVGSARAHVHALING
jgi:hypothetical protein